MDDAAKHRIWVSQGQWTIQHPAYCNIDTCAVRALVDRDNAMARLYRLETERQEQIERHSTQRIPVAGGRVAGRGPAPSTPPPRGSGRPS